METNFKSLIHLLDYFKEETTCKAYLAEQRWGGNPSCPHCGSAKTPYVTNRGYRCREKECDKKFTVITGTIYENTKISLRYWFAAMYLITAHKKGISSLQLSRDLNITQKTAWFMLHRIREMIQNRSMEKMTGTVEVDETYVGGNPKNKHEHKRLGSYERNFAPVIAIVERGGSVVVKVLEAVRSEHIFRLIKNIVNDDARLITDGHTAYSFVGRTYNHIVVKHTHSNGKLNYKTYGDKHTNTVEGFFSHFKRMIIGTYHFTSRKHLQRYCDEMAFRFSTRDIKDGERFNLSFAGCNTRLKYADLIR